MVNKKMSILCLLIILLSSFNAMADGYLIFDGADLFNTEERGELNQRLQYISDLYDMDILIVTTEDAQGKNSRNYADDYFDYGGYGRNESYDGMLFLIDLDNREIYISTSGRAIEYLNDRDIENILDKVFERGILEGDFHMASSTFIDQTNSILNKKLGENTLTYLEAFVSLTIGIVGALAFFIIVENKYKFKNARKVFDYQKNSIVNLKDTNDIFINKIISHRRIPKNNNTGGGSNTSTHRSSSGRTHGGGGRKF